MLNQILKNLYFYISGLIIFETFFSLISPLKSSYLNQNFLPILQKNNNLLSYKKKEGDILFNKNFIELGDKLRNDLIDLEDEFVDFILLSESNTNDDFNVEIESDIQYQKDNIFFAEGDVTLYLTNATLKGDQVQYDQVKKQLTILGDVRFSKGNQYFEASKIYYDINKKQGYIDNIYGILDVESLDFDFDLKQENLGKNILEEDLNEVKGIKNINSISIGLVNDFEQNNKFNLTEVELKVPSIKKWRYKSKKVYLKNTKFISEDIFFTNDAFNQPQLFLRSRNFEANRIEDKLKIVSKRSSLILDNKLKLPLGRRTIFDKDPITNWFIGSDNTEKDGFYISRNFRPIKLSDDFNLKLTPYYLIQRSFKGSTNSFRAPKESILSNKVKSDINLSDVFALDSEIEGSLDLWKINLKQILVP